jgi:hypothetical protein
MTDTTLKVLREWAPFEYKRLNEGKGPNEKIMMRGILQKADVLNQNGRIYPREILEAEIQNYQKFIVENRALGELDHPETSVVELKNVSHIVREAKMDRDGVVWGAIEVLSTPAGNILKSLVEAGVTIGISSRGVGSTKNEGGRTMVQDDFQLICWDIVSEPSTPNAFIMREGRELTRDELKALREGRFTKDVRLDRIFNEVLTWRNK